MAVQALVENEIEGELIELDFSIFVAAGMCCKWYKPDSTSASPIIFHLWRFCKTHLDWKKNKPIGLSFVNLEAEIRLILNVGT